MITTFGKLRQEGHGCHELLKRSQGERKGGGVLREGENEERSRRKKKEISMQGATPSVTTPASLIMGRQEEAQWKNP